MTNIDELKQQGDITELFTLMSEAKDWLVRLDAAEALALLGDPHALAYLKKIALSSADDDTREVALEILEGLRRQEVPVGSMPTPDDSAAMRGIALLSQILSVQKEQARHLTNISRAANLFTLLILLSLIASFCSVPNIF